MYYYERLINSELIDTYKVYKKDNGKLFTAYMVKNIVTIEINVLFSLMKMIQIFKAFIVG